jgi:hypothetical protein
MDHGGEIVDAVVIDVAVDVPDPAALAALGVDRKGSMNTVVRVLPPGMTLRARSNRSRDLDMESG